MGSRKLAQSWFSPLETTPVRPSSGGRVNKGDMQANTAPPACKQQHDVTPKKHVQMQRTGHSTDIGSQHRQLAFYHDK